MNSLTRFNPLKLTDVSDCNILSCSNILTVFAHHCLHWRRSNAFSCREHSSRALLQLISLRALLCPSQMSSAITKPADLSFSTTQRLIGSRSGRVGHQCDRDASSVCREPRLSRGNRWLCCGLTVTLFTCVFFEKGRWFLECTADVFCEGALVLVAADHLNIRAGWLMEPCVWSLRKTLKPKLLPVRVYMKNVCPFL